MKRVTHLEARRAVFVDFECLVERARPVPMVMGALIGSGGEEFQQVITDERLTPAQVARRGATVVIPTPDAVDTIVRLACDEDRLIAGWSFFDRDRMIEARRDLENHISARYVNALQVARPWRQALHPDYPIEREDEYAPKHTLDKYAVLAGYPRARILFGAEPARWLRHTIDQLDARGGRYRSLTKQAKRDWHRLLEYNRHDCLALRHILVKASRELEGWRAYERTKFCVHDGAQQVCFKAGSKTRRLDRLLDRHAARRWAIVTACQPGTVRVDGQQNPQRQTELLRAVAEKGFDLLPGKAIGGDPSQEPQDSVMIFGISRAEATRIGRDFDQLAIVVGKRGAPPQLVAATERSTLRTPGSPAR